MNRVWILGLALLLGCGEEEKTVRVVIEYPVQQQGNYIAELQARHIEGHLAMLKSRLKTAVKAQAQYLSEHGSYATDPRELLGERVDWWDGSEIRLDGAEASIVSNRGGCFKDGIEAEIYCRAF